MRRRDGEWPHPFGHQLSDLLLISQNASHLEHIEYVGKIVALCNDINIHLKLVFLLINKH